MSGKGFCSPWGQGWQSHLEKLVKVTLCLAQGPCTHHSPPHVVSLLCLGVRRRIHQNHTAGSSGFGANEEEEATSSLLLLVFHLLYFPSSVEN